MTKPPKHALRKFVNAILNNDVAAVDVFFEKFGKEYLDEMMYMPGLASGVTPLMLAAKNDRQEMTQHLIDLGADLDVRDHLQRTALMQVAGRHVKKENSGKMARILLMAGANISLKDSFKLTAMNSATVCRNIDVIKEIEAEKKRRRDPSYRDPLAVFGNGLPRKVIGIKIPFAGTRHGNN